MHVGTISGMHAYCAIFVLLVSWVYGLTAKEALDLSSLDANGEDGILTSLKNYDGWVNPEDLSPMPQCIAQQDQSSWLRAMTECTDKRCTSHFTFICTHHQWLTQLSCLSIEFSPSVVDAYLPYCSRSVLAKAQLYQWIRTVTGRTWLVNVGDANGLETLSPASLSKGYLDIEVIYKAPNCLTGSNSASSREPFQHVMASCSFTSISEHTGNAARPWEYRESLRSMIALDSETAGYDLTNHVIGYGDYFDKECFCSTFAMNPRDGPCSASGGIDLTKERLWLNATCGPTSLPDHWTDALKITPVAYIPVSDWRWPRCVTDMPKQLTELTDQCATDACELDSDGYCKVVPAVERACFCRSISYDACGGSCHLFETRVDYVKWLHDLCGDVQDWHGLPDDWRQLASPTRLDMIPWRWKIGPSNDTDLVPNPGLGSIKPPETCPSTGWKLGGLALINVATFLAACIVRRTEMHRAAPSVLWQPWLFKGVSITALQLIPNWLNAFLVQNTTGYEDVPIIQLMLLWCTMPRLTGLATLVLAARPFKTIDFTAAASSLFAETVIQVLSSYYMIMTVNYGRLHDFYVESMERLEGAVPAKSMYAGALLWLVVSILAFAQYIAFSDQYSMWLGENGPNQSIARNRALEEASSKRSTEKNYTVYGTLPVEQKDTDAPQKPSSRLYTVTVMVVFLLWISQWLFWAGFIRLSLEEYCPPKLGILTAVWMAFSFVSVYCGVN